MENDMNTGAETVTGNAIDASRVIWDAEPVKSIPKPAIDENKVVWDAAPRFSVSRKDWGRLRKSFAGDGDFLAFIDDPATRADIEAITNRSGDPATEKMKLSLAAYYAEMNKKDISFVRDNLDSFIERYNGGEKQSVPAAYNAIKNLFHGNNEKDGLGSRILWRMAAGAGENAKSIYNFAALVAGLTGETGSAIAGLEARKDAEWTGKPPVQTPKPGEMFRKVSDAVRSPFKNYYRDTLDFAYEKSQVPDDWMTNSDSFGDWVGNAAVSVIGYIPELAGQTALTVATGGVTALGGVYGINKFFDLSDEYPEMPLEKRILNAVATGIINGIGEKITFGILKGNVSKKMTAEGIKKGLLRAGLFFGMQGGKEAGEEAGEQFSENLVDILTGVHGDYKQFDTAKWNKLLFSGVPESAFLGFATGGPLAFDSYRNLRAVDQHRIGIVNRLEEERAQLLQVENPSDAQAERLKRVEAGLDAGNINDLAAVSQREEARAQLRDIQAEEGKTEELPDLGYEPAEDVSREAILDARAAIEEQRAIDRVPHNPATTREAVTEVMNEFPDMQYEVVENPAEFGEEALSILNGRGVSPENVRGFYDAGTDTMYVNAARVRPSEVPRLVQHELVGHKGLRAVCGERLDSVLMGIASEHIDEIGKVAELYHLDTGTNSGLLEASEEYLAQLAENREMTKPGWWKSMLQSVKMVLRSVPGFRNLRYTDGEIETLLQKSAQAVRGKRGGAADRNVRFLIREKEPPVKTGIGYKVFVVKNGKLYPPMVNPSGEATPIGVWLDAEEGIRAGDSKTGRPQVKAGGPGTQGGSGTLAYRPGWHLGEYPLAVQFNRADETGNKTLFPENFVWGEVEYANDVDYQKEAESEGITASGKYQHSLAGLKKVPVDGAYRYRTNPNPETVPWIITGSMKVNRILTDSEVESMLSERGIKAPKRQGGDSMPDIRFSIQKSELTINKDMTVKGAMDALKTLAGKDLVNLETGITARINTRQRNKITSNAALDKSILNGFTAGQHNAAAARIDKLWKHAVLLEERKDRDNDPNIQSIKRFAAPVIFNGEIGAAYITAKESLEQGHRIYSIELVEIEKLRPKGDVPFGNATAGAWEKIQRIAENVKNGFTENSEEFKRWFGDSKVVDENGKPLVVYHNTNSEFTVFDKNRIGSSNDHGWLGRGFYFYGDPVEGNGYGKNKMAAYLSIKEPYFITAEEQSELIDASDRNDSDFIRSFTDDLIHQGYDGVYYNGDLRQEWVAFEPEQIKSATDNVGTYDANNPDIRFSMQYSEEEHARMVAAIRPYVGLYATKENADYLKFYQERHLPVHTEADAKFFAVFAAKENMKESHARVKRMRSDWLYENVPMWRQVSEFTGSDDFLIRPSFRFQGQEFTGSFISPEFRKNSGKKGDKAAKKMKGAEGYHSNEIARAIAGKYGGDELKIEQDIIDFFGNMKKRDLHKMYSDDKKQRILQNQDMERRAREEWEASRHVRAEEEVIDILEHGRQITEEFPQENPIAYRLLYEKLFPGETVPKNPGKIELESINAALAQEAADASTYAQARRDARKASFADYMEKVKALKEKVMQSKADALKLQRAAADFAEKNLSPENRGEFTRGILSLLDYSTVPSEKNPEGRRMSEFNKLLESMLERGGKARKADAVGRIGEMLDAAKIRRNYKGIPTSVLPSEQARVDRIRQIVGMDVAGVGNWIEWNNNELSRLETEGKEDTPEAERLREDNQLLDIFGALERKEPGKAEEAEKILKGIIRGGRMAFKGKLEERKAAVQDMRYKTIHEITFGRDTTGREEAKKHSRIVLLNESLGTLLRIVSGQNIGTFDESQAGKLYRTVEDSTQKEQTALRKMQTDLDGALRDFAGVKGLLSKGRFFRMIGKTEEKSGVFVTQYTRAVPQGENVVFEEGRRQTVTKGIPVEDTNGRKGARSLLAEIDSGKEVTSWNGIPLDEVSIEFLRKQVADFDSGLKQSYEIFSEESDDAQFNRMIEEERKSGRVVLFGHDPKETSRRVEVPLSQAAALQILLTWEQGDYKANMKWNGWDEESIGQLKAFIKPEVLKTGYWMRDYIAKNKASLDEKVYDRYGARLPENENYFPASFKGGAGRKITGDGAFGKGAGQMSINPGFLIARKFHLKPVDMDSDAFSNFMANQLEQSHFLAWSDAVRDLKSVYGNQQVQNAIKNQFGGDVVTELVDRIDTIARGGGKFSTDQAQKLFGKFYRYWVPAKIALNAGSVMKQVFGMSAYMNQIPVKDFCSNLAKANYANKDFREFVKWAKETDYVKNRLSGGLDKDLQYMLNYTRDSEAYSPWSDALLNYGTMPTRWADLYSTLHGGYTVYRYHLEKAKKAGMDANAAHEEAARAWMRATDETQQSGYLKDQNYFQANQGLYRYLTMFMTNPIQVMNLQLQTVNELRYGSDKKAAGKKLMKQVFVNHFVLPSLMCLANDLLRRGLNIEDYEFEDYATGWVLGQFESFFLFGKLASSLLNFAADKAAGRSTYGRSYFSSLPLADDLENGISFLFRELKDDEITEKDILDGIKVAGDFGIAGGVLDSRVGAVGGILSALGSQAKRFYRLFSQEEPGK